MSERREIEQILAAELRYAHAAPPSLWPQIRSRLEGEQRARPRHLVLRPAWTFGVFAVLVLFLAPITLRQSFRANSDVSFDLSPYLAPVQSSSAASSTRAIYNAPPQFDGYDGDQFSIAPAGYEFALERSASINGEPLRQLIFKGRDHAVALFVGSSKVRFDAPSENWVEEKFGNLQCRRINCPRVRTVQFPCARHTCLLVCKACSEEAMLSLVTEVASLAESAY